MENIHSFEQKSSSGSHHELRCKNRVIIVDRHNPDSKWSTQNQPRKSSTLRWFERLWAYFRPKRRADIMGQTRSPGNSLSGGASISSFISNRSRISFRNHPDHIPHEQEVDYGPFASNEWCSSKYTLLGFLPRNLFEQFRRLANFYFLTTAMIQILLPYSPIGPTTSLVPLLFVVLTTAIKQAYEDFLRHRLDNQVNKRVCYVLVDKNLVKVRSRDIKVGDIVFVRNNEEVPCDMILLATSGSGDRCYITTANLDGETNPKSRSCFNIRTQVGSIDKLDDTLLVVECEQPNATLYEFNGILRVSKDEDAYNELLNAFEHGESGRGLSRRGEFRAGSPTILSAIYNRVRRESMSTQVRKSIREPKFGTIESRSTSESFHEIPLDMTNLLLRASRLKNTTYVYGMAVYTGPDTKLAHNSHVKPNKFSSIESKVNLYLFLAFTLLMTGSMIAALNHRRYDYWYLQDLTNSDSFGQLLLSHFLIYNYLVPISLYVTLEFVKFFGTVAVVKDKSMQMVVMRSITNMKSDESERLQAALPVSKSLSERVKTVEGAKCNSSDLNEDLGQVEVLFSDKTGTLTENKMKFIACCVYGSLVRLIEDRLYLVPRETQGAIPIPRVVPRIASVVSNRYAFITPNSNISINNSRQFHSESSIYFDHRIVPPFDKLKAVQDSPSEVERVADFFTCLCLCSTLTLNENNPISQCLPDQANNEYDYQSASPDEESLIATAATFGIRLCKSSESECIIAISRSLVGNRHSRRANKGSYNAIVETINSTDQFIVRQFKRLISLEFDSTRKRMSVIYKDCDNDCLLLVAKGSESLLDCIKMSQISAEDELTINTSLAYFEAFAKSGLRTMFAARGHPRPAEYDKLQDDIREARLSQQNRIQKLNSAYKRMEANLKLVGVTAVEDSLQEGVPRTISNLRAAGIKVWLLTGDKVETAISVAHLCKLLDRNMTLFNLVRQQDAKSCIETLESFERQLEESGSALVSLKLPEASGGKQRCLPGMNRGLVSPDDREKSALVVDGRSLYFALKYAKEEFSAICKQCACVLGCRLSPLQKAEIVTLVKNFEDNPITAAIGDGANDVSMIQESHVGIGIIGKEGRQAVNSSDFAINRFHMLNKLFFVHGHLFYHRTANLIHYFFYKNMLFILPQFIYSFFSLSSGSSIYHPVELICYNLVYTSMPIIVFGLYETHIPEKTLERYPALYQMNRRNYQLRLKMFLSWLLLGVIQAMIAFYWFYSNWGDYDSFLQSGEMTGSGGLARVLFTSIIFIGLVRLCMLSHQHSWLLIFATTLSVLLLLGTYVVCGLFDWCKYIGDITLYGQSFELVTSPTFWVAVISTTSASIIPDIIWCFQDKIATARKVYQVISDSEG